MAYTTAARGVVAAARGGSLFSEAVGMLRVVPLAAPFYVVAAGTAAGE